MFKENEIYFLRQRLIAMATRKILEERAKDFYYYEHFRMSRLEYLSYFYSTKPLPIRFIVHKLQWNAVNSLRYDIRGNVEMETIKCNIMSELK